MKLHVTGLSIGGESGVCHRDMRKPGLDTIVGEVEKCCVGLPGAAAKPMSPLLAQDYEAAVLSCPRGGGGGKLASASYRQNRN